MALDWYRRPRLVVFTPAANAHEAACAMLEHDIGSILVVEHKRVIGIVTDRDLAVKVVAMGRAPKKTKLSEIMTRELATVEVDRDLEEVARQMRLRGCRRIPITENGAPVGIVTLDDLLLDASIEVRTARSIVVAQLERALTQPHKKSAPLTRSPAEQRRRARADSTFARLLRSIERHAGISDHERAARALTIVLSAICRRITPQEARHFIAQLPSKLHPDLEPHLTGPDKGVTPDGIEAELRRSLHVDRATASDLLYAVCDVVQDSVSAGEIESLKGQLPASMKSLFSPALHRAAL